MEEWIERLRRDWEELEPELQNLWGIIADVAEDMSIEHVLNSL